MLRSSFDLELYHYIINDSNYEHKSSIYLKHKAARELIKNRNYLEAIKALNEIISERNSETYNAHLMFLVYTDMEFCSKQLMDFESAYKYASKKLSMIEGFKAWLFPIFLKKSLKNDEWKFKKMGYFIFFKKISFFFDKNLDYY